MELIRSATGLRALRDRARRLLAVFPHPDDEAYGPAGALARLGRDPDGAAAVLCLTRGEASRMGPERGLTPEEVAELREGRLVEVAGILGLDAMIVERFPDSRLARCNLAEVAAAIDAVLEAFDPQVVVTHDPRGVNAHPDHIAAHWALRHALVGRPVQRLAMLAYPPEVAELARPRLLFATPEEEIDCVVSLDERETEAKEKSLRVHEALVTLDPAAAPGTLVLRPPVERYDFLGEECEPPLADLFEGLA